MRVYRAVSEAERVDILESRSFRVLLGMMEGKWFADTIWGARLHGDSLHGAGHFFIAEAEVDKAAYESAYHDSNLDGFGPSTYFEMNDLLAIVPMCVIPP